MLLLQICTRSAFFGVFNCCVTKGCNKPIIQGSREKNDDSDEHILTEFDFFPLRDILCWRKAS